MKLKRYLTLIGGMGYAVNSIAVDPTTDILYASTTTWSGEFNGLLQVDPNTGAATEIGEFGTEFVAILALTFDSSGQLWGWHDPSEDDPVTIDKTTGAATTVGESGISTGGHVMAFNPSDVLYFVQSATVFIIDQMSGAANFQGNLSFDPGAGGAAFDATGTLWASRENGQTQDSWIRLTDIDGNSFTDIDTDVEYLNALTWGDAVAVAPDPRATFQVNKDFDDDNTDSVQVTISCNTGLPLEQTTEIEEGDGVEFVVVDFSDGEMDCEITEVDLLESGIEVDDSKCQGLVVFPGTGASCTIFNTRLFEGIPTLSQYGLGLLALLMLGMGFVAFRRVI